MASKKTKIKTKRVYLTFTETQMKMIDEIVQNGELGSTTGDALKQIILYYIRDKQNGKRI